MQDTLLVQLTWVMRRGVCTDVWWVHQQSGKHWRMSAVVHAPHQHLAMAKGRGFCHKQWHHAALHVTSLLQ